jgi:hypothetical protein
MKMLIIAIGGASGIIANPALADRPGASWIGRPALNGAIFRQGYHVVKVEADDGHWEGEMSKVAKLYEFHADPHAGRLTKIELKHSHRP